MLLWIVWVAVAVVAVVVLGSVLYGVVGALRRLQREVAAVRTELLPPAEEIQCSLAAAQAASAARGRAADDG